MRLTAVHIHHFAVFPLLILPFLCSAAFEPVPESPLLQGGITSTLFPSSPLVLFSNPSSLGLLESSAVSASASRPFGLSRLDRSAVAGVLCLETMHLGSAISISGDRSYTELTAALGCAISLGYGAVGGTCLAVRSLHISGYGRGTGGSLNTGILWSPVEGIYFTGVLNSLLRTDLGNSGDPASPRSIDVAIGVIPDSRIQVSAGASRQEHLDTELIFQTAFSPVSGLMLNAGIKTDPARFWGALWFSLSSLSLEYGYGEHTDLPGTHSLSLCWGDCASRPQPLKLTGSESRIEPTFPLDPNTATEEELQLIPGVGPSKAAAIASWIRINGPVTSVDQLEEVPGIGPSLMSVLLEYLTVP